MCDERSIEQFSSRVKSLKISSSSSRAIGSSPLVASSSIRSFAPCESAAAMASFMRIPRE